MFDVLMYLFETYIHTALGIQVDQDKLTDDLTRAGFEREDIYSAFGWLEKLAIMQETNAMSYTSFANPYLMRIYTTDEMIRLDSTCRGFILFLEQIQVLTPETREMVIDRVMALDTDHLDIDYLEWVVLMVLFNVPGHEYAYKQMEELLFKFHDGYLH
ncbi:DUF494 family protein [Candidatus Profftia sp. (ex Adelges kitamiensis)]|uniref:DUF494 family protein n=1 Tax=Candidatus Profftia sp. (ex Adelges kitamiensis) TaxID=2864218 RepID=UPI001CE372D8|nr:DUF494 family protein [Candidatus Profftia sp. (ex Adelges kitamiensis)]